jgi:hypothetical protein
MTSSKGKRRGRAPHPQNQRPARRRRRHEHQDARFPAQLLAVAVVAFCVLAGLVWLLDAVIGYHPILP